MMRNPYLGFGGEGPKKVHYLEKTEVVEMPEWHFSVLSGKLEGLVSLSTSCLDEPFCKAQVYDESPDNICRKCYAVRALRGFRKTMRTKLAGNSALLNRPYFERPGRFPVAVALRLLSHGDITNNVQATNLYKIASVAPEGMPVALWSKNWKAFRTAFADKPGRLVMLWSSKAIDAVDIKPVGFDKVFTVFRGEVPEGIFKCPGKCADCLVCYRHNDVTSVGITLHR